MRGMLRRIGSLKLAVVLLVALAVAMAVASMYEVRHGTEAALRDFYGSRWFAALLAAIGVNVLAALLVRRPLRWSRAGFVIAHVAILVILVGALVTRVSSVHGRLWLRNQQARSDFDGDGWVLALSMAGGKERAEVPVDPDGPRFDPADAQQQVGGVTWTIEQFAADTEDEGQRIVADANAPQPAVKIRFGHGPHQHEQWLLGGRPTRVGGLRMRLLRVTDATVLRRLLRPTSLPTPPERGKLVAEVDGRRYVIDVASQPDRTVPLGETGYRARIQRYLPHAQVSGREIRSITSRPVNPMIEFDLIDPAGKTERHRLFARFPDRDFSAAHARTTAPATSPATQPVKFRYIDATILPSRRNGIDLLLDANDGLHARFIDADGSTTSRDLMLNRETPVPGRKTQLTVLELVPHARSERALTPIPPRKENAMPAAFVCLRAPGTAHRLWVRRGERFDIHLGGQHVQVSYVPTRIPLGFSIKLLAPVITSYPGSDRPRTYESRVLIEDPHGGVKLEQTISMNAPLKYGGYAFYQSSYQFDRRNQPAASMLSVVSDPGEPVVYVGYVGLILGMVIALAQQVARRRRSRQVSAAT